jgi:hypothetical protein
MGDRLAGGKFHMAGGATRAAPCFRVLIAAGVEVALQAAAPEHVVRQVKNAADFLVLGNLKQRGEILVGAKGPPDGVHFVFYGEVKRVFGLGMLLRVTGAAGLVKKEGVGRLFAHAGVSCFRIRRRVLSRVTGDAGDGRMAGIQRNIVAIPAGRVMERGGCRGGRFLSGRGIGAAGGAEQKDKKKQA